MPSAARPTAQVDPRFGHDLSFPYLMVQNGYRAVYEPSARATESMTTDIEDEFRRKVRMFEHCWLILFRGRMFGLRRLGPVYWVEIVSHRLLRYWSGPLHLRAARDQRRARDPRRPSTPSCWRRSWPGSRSWPSRCSCAAACASCACCTTTCW